MTISLLLQEAQRAEFSIWGVIIPATVFIISFVVTMMLYRHFAKQTEE